MARLSRLLLVLSVLVAAPAAGQVDGKRFRLDELIFTVPAGWKQVTDASTDGSTVVEYIPADQEHAHWWDKLRITSSANKANANPAQAATFIASQIERNCALGSRAQMVAATKDKRQIFTWCKGPKPASYPPGINVKPYEASIITIMTRGKRIYLIEVGWRNGWPDHPSDEERKFQRARAIADLAGFG